MTHKFHISGTHCASCKILIEDILSKDNLVESAKIRLKEEILEVNVKGDMQEEELAARFNSELKTHGYTVSTEKQLPLKKETGELYKAVPLGIGVLVLFFMLQKSGILYMGLGSAVSPATAFVVGLVASVSSCLAIVGGLVLSLSAKISGDGADKKAFALFHLARILSFGILGGALGALGGAIGVSFTFSAILGVIASAVMIFLGLNLTGIVSKSRISLPPGLFGFFRKVEHETWTPVLVGLGTFFLPCGFTQSMQVAALSSGSFLSGSILMLSFALGTLPMLAALSFGAASFAHSKHASLFLRSAGVVVLGLGLFSLMAGLVGLGIISPIWNI